MVINAMRNNLGFNEYLKIRDAANVLGVHPDTLRRWEREKKLNTYRHPLNRYRLYLRSELENLLREVEDL
jgi:excisionase family DNA binding protein